MQPAAAREGCNAGLVRVEPAGFEIALAPGEPLMAAAQKAGIRWPTVCNGQAQCGLCAVEVLTAGEAVSAPQPRERQMLSRLTVKPRQGGTMRLACQFTVSGNATVLKLGVRAPR